jgi:flavodoxin
MPITASLQDTSRNVLVCYYSMTGNTRRLAQEIQRATGAGLEEIREPRPRHGFSGVVRALFDAVTKRQPALMDVQHDPASVDLLVLGGPIWAGRLASPVRAYATRFGKKAPRLAFFCTEGSEGAEAAFAELEALTGHAGLAALAVDARHLDQAAHAQALRDFITRLEAVPTGGDAAPVAATTCH